MTLYPYERSCDGCGRYIGGGFYCSDECEIAARGPRQCPKCSETLEPDGKCAVGCDRDNDK